MSEEIAIKVEGVYKDFKLPHQKTNSIKSIFTGLHKKRVKGFETQHALRDISFEVKKGEFFGIVGRNGSGKSTLLKIIAEIYQPTKGKLQKSGKLVPFIELGVGFNPELTGRENVYLNGALLGFSEKEIDEQYDDIVSFAELEPFMDQKLKNYSSGMQVRLAFSVATRADADILLIDEVLAVGDADFQKKCFKYFKQLKKDKKTIIFVSHDMNAVQEYCDRAILIEKSEVVASGPSFEVANDYTRMFLQGVHDGKTSNRWGDGDVKYKKVTLNSREITDANSTIKITAEATAQKDTEHAIFGFRIRYEDDTLILGSNSHLKKQEFRDLRKGETVVLSWEFPNILNTGKYFADLGIQSKDYEETYDHWDAATSFSVQRGTDNSYPVHPNIELSVVKDAHDKE